LYQHNHKYHLLHPATIRLTLTLSNILRRCRINSSRVTHKWFSKASPSRFLKYCRSEQSPFQWLSSVFFSAT
jgi:hypothetical protein